MEIAEYAGIDRVVAIAVFLLDHGVLGALILEYLCGDLEAARTALVEQSLGDCSQEVVEESTAIPERLRNYIDWEAMARDTRRYGEVFTVEIAHDEVHVFWSR